MELLERLRWVLVQAHIDPLRSWGAEHTILQMGNAFDGTDWALWLVKYTTHS